jgi:hypothetical protein
MTIKGDGGNVGIGVIDPDSALEVQSASSGNNSLHIANTSSTGYGAKFLGGGNTATRYIADFRNYSGVSKVKIDGDGNVGIGTSAPVNNSNRTTLGLQGVWGGQLDIMVGSTVHAQFGSDNFGTGQSARIQSQDGIVFKTNGNNERMRIDNSGNVGIGTTSPSEKLVLANGSNEIKFGLDGSSHDIFSNGKTFNIGTTDGTVVRFFENNSEAMRLSGGNLLVGKTATDSGTVGFEVAQDGHVYVTVNNTLPFYINRQSGSELQRFASNGTTVGSIKTYNSTVQYGGAAAAIYLDTAAFLPANASGRTDNTIDLGNGSYRYNDVFATNGTIQTSDRNEKQDIAELTDAEQRVAVVAKGLLRKFRWIDAVEEKGDEARTHFGIIAQDLQAAFADEGLDAGDYAMFTSSTWTDEDTGEERTRMGVRYSELLAFIIAAI